MAAALSTCDFCAHHSVTNIAMKFYCARQCFIKTGPASARIKLGVGRKQLVATTCTLVHSPVFIMQEFSCARQFCAFITKNIILLWIKRCLPFLFRLFELFHICYLRSFNIKIFGLVLNRNTHFFVIMEDITFIILGVTGDLTKRKLIPALHKLLSDNKITKLAIVGVSRSATSMEPILAAAEQFIKKDEHWERLKQSSHALSMNFDNPEDYKKLAELVNTIEHKNSLSGNRIFYFATLPEHFGTITTNIAKQGLAKTKGWSRLVY